MRCTTGLEFRDKLHWLRARERITFKLCLLVYKATNGLAPSYIQDLCVPVTTISTRAALRSAARGDLVLPRTRRRLGNQAFCVAGPAAWNSLPTFELHQHYQLLKTVSRLICFCSHTLYSLIRVAYFLSLVVTLRTCYGAL